MIVSPRDRRDSAVRPPSADSAPQPLEPPAEGHVVVLGRSGCHLCDDVQSLIAGIARTHPELIPDGAVQIDVDSDLRLRARWGDHVPVTFVDGVLIAYWHLDRDTLMAALTDGPTPVRVIP